MIVQNRTHTRSTTLEDENIEFRGLWITYRSPGEFREC